MSAASGIPSERVRTYAELEHRNRFVSWMRILVPILGALVLIALLGQLIAASITSQFLPDGVRMERDNLVIDAPSYSGVMQDGTRYTVVSEIAEAAIDTPDTINLEIARIDLTRPWGQEIVGEAEQAQFTLSDQRVNVAGILHVTESGGSVAELQDSVFDWTAQTMDTNGNVQVTFADGTVLTSATLHFDAQTQEWDFRLVKLVVPGEASQ